jgi:hypothetical protein
MIRPGRSLLLGAWPIIVYELRSYCTAVAEAFTISIPPLSPVWIGT